MCSWDLLEINHVALIMTNQLNKSNQRRGSPSDKMNTMFLRLISLTDEKTKVITEI